MLLIMSYIKQEDYVVLINDTESLFLRAKLHVAPTANIGTDVSVKPVSSDVTELGNYNVLFYPPSHSLPPSVSLSLYSCDV